MGTPQNSERNLRLHTKRGGLASTRRYSHRARHGAVASVTFLVSFLFISINTTHYDEDHVYSVEVALALGHSTTIPINLAIADTVVLLPRGSGLPLDFDKMNRRSVAALQLGPFPPTSSILQPNTRALRAVPTN